MSARLEGASSSEEVHGQDLLAGEGGIVVSLDPAYVFGQVRVGDIVIGVGNGSLIIPNKKCLTIKDNYSCMIRRLRVDEKIIIEP